MSFLVGMVSAFQVWGFATISMSVSVEPTKKNDCVLLCLYSDVKCSAEVPAECAEFIPYTTYPNKLFNLTTEDEYGNFSASIEFILRNNCTDVDEYWATWGVCNMMFPRCLQGFELQLCRNTCLDGVRYSCNGEGRDYLESLCMKLPDEECLPAIASPVQPCGEHEFSCGDGQCIPGLGVCNNKYECLSGADEEEWYVIFYD
ncbi:hypothetical protein EB796_024123 [Bugula neritina]|uniref:Uncharacterized protein n=1 Tax=Bugula neritina TaxID=10212 RepID=A0A7J7IUF8_BUGNE|nr:hypothetical protein EB796_024123 [Bugula neritina]